MAELTFDFPDPDTGISRRTAFRDPARVVAARGVEEVVPALEAVERAVAGGLHAAGFLAYEAAPAFEPRMRVRTGGSLPLLWFGLFDGPSPSSSPDDAPPPRARARPEWTPELDRTEYECAIAAVKEAIAEGQSYQVNLTTRLRAALGSGTDASPVALYESLRRAQGPGYHALLDLGSHVIASVSPELFFRTRGRAITTRPMKGTRPRGRWPAEDAALASELVASEKDRAENLMIVDLLRNDLGRVCETGSVRVPRLFGVERYRTVWQLTSTVEGRLRDDVGLVDLLRAVFPCGSVTGAPKISTMELIARLEASPREVYCGAIGMIEPGGSAVFNVPIRTLWWHRDTGAAQYGAGGGVVWDSTAGGEYDELLAKAVVVREPWPAFSLVETMALEDGRLLRLERHLQRLEASAAYFGFPFPGARIRRTLDDLVAGSASDVADGGRQRALRVRLTLDDRGRVAVEHRPLGPVGRDDPLPATDPAADRAAGHAGPVRVAIATQPVDSSDRFLFHKTTHRAVHDQRAAERPGSFDVLLHNERGEVTEFIRGNVVALLDGRLITPPRDAGLLAGCFRQELLDSGLIEERTIRLDDLPRASRLWFINSARRWLEVELGEEGATRGRSGP